MHNSVGEALEIGIEVGVGETVKMMVKMMENRKTQRALEGVFVPFLHRRELTYATNSSPSPAIFFPSQNPPGQRFALEIQLNFDNAIRFALTDSASEVSALPNRSVAVFSQLSGRAPSLGYRMCIGRLD